MRNPNSHLTLPKVPNPKQPPPPSRKSGLTLSLPSFLFFLGEPSISQASVMPPLVPTPVPCPRCRRSKVSTRDPVQAPPFPLPNLPRHQATATPCARSRPGRRCPTPSETPCPQLHPGRRRSQCESVQVAIVPCARTRTSHRHSLRETPATPPPTPTLRLRPDLRRRRWTLNPVAGVGHPMGNPLPTWGRVWGIF
jgi:hypothetical protein